MACLQLLAGSITRSFRVRATFRPRRLRSFVAAFPSFLFYIPTLSFFVPLFTPFLFLPPFCRQSSVFFLRSFVRSCGDAGSRSACALRVCFPAAQVFPVCNARLLSVKQSTFARVLFFLSFLFLSSLVAVRPETKGAFQSRRNLRKLTGLCERCLATRHHLTSKTDTVWFSQTAQHRAAASSGSPPVSA